MRRRGKVQRGWIVLGCAVLLLCACPAVNPAWASQPAGSPEVRAVETELNGNAVRYPQLVGLADEAVQQAINDAVVEQGKIAQRMVTLSLLKDGGAGLQVTYEAFLGGGVFSTVLSAKGVMENGRTGQEYAAMSFHLATGQPVTLDELFTDPDAAVSRMEDVLLSTYLDELSSYLENSDLTPLPRESFNLDADGITFYYPYRQFALLSGYCGAAQFCYDELAGELRTDTDALPAKLGAITPPRAQDEIRQLIEQTVSQGALPHISARLGDGMADLIGRYRLLRTPDQYPGGRYFQLEAPSFRQVLVLSDALSGGWDNSRVEGLLSYRANLFGLQCGVTSSGAWHAILGEPDSSVAFDEALAYDYGLIPGTADYYSFGERQLLLYAGEDGVLYAVRLT